MTHARVALVQLNAGRSPEKNLVVTEQLVREAAAAGAIYVQTPEVSNIMEHDGEKLFAALADEASDITLARLRTVAAELGIWLHIGSLGIRIAPDKAANRAFVIRPDGSIAARYDKIHLFDVDLAGGESYRESARIRPGAAAVTVDLPFGRLGLAICYDLRFPQLFRDLAQAGATLLALPAAFTRKTGARHWEVLLRARAIENGAYVLAAAQSGLHENGRETWGHSMIVAPDGGIVAMAEAEGPGVVVADIDPAAVGTVRAAIPSLGHDRAFTSAQAETKETA
jgi:predicted amidohydrolase